MNEIVAKALKPVLLNGKVYVPESLKKVKIDVGLAWNAPNSEYWLSREDNVCVFGFEPSTKNHKRFIDENEKTRVSNPAHVVIKQERIYKNFFIEGC